MKTKFIQILTLSLMMVFQVALAQQTVTGTVTDADGLPVPGATVVVKGTSTATTADFDGNYSIAASNGDVLVISYVGYNAAEVTVNGATANASLTSSTALDEVIVTAYGTQTKQSVVGSVAVISADVIEAQKVTSVTQALQGTVPGVNIITSGGVPGTNPTIRIRGVGSINAAASPLIIVDGAPYAGNLNSISQDQVESISVLKDASATALYGSLAANGVILITTKSGDLNSKAKISVNVRSGVASQAVDLHQTLGIDNWSELYWESMRNRYRYIDGDTDADARLKATNGFGSSVGYSPYGTANPVNTSGRVVTNPLWDTSWEDAIINDQAQFNEVGVNLSGGSDSTTYFFSTNYLTEEGNVETTKFDRYATRIKVDSKVNDFISAGMNVGYAVSKTNTPNQAGNGYSSTVQWIYNVPNFFPIYRRDANGEFLLDASGNKLFDYGSNSGQAVNGVRPVFEDENAYGSLYVYDIYNNRNDFNANVYADVKFSDNLTFRSTLAYQSYLYDSYQYIDRDNGYASSVNGRVTQQRDITTQTNAIQQLNYKTSFNNSHNVEADVIYVANSYKFDNLGASGEGFLPNVKILNGSTTPSDVDGYYVEQRFTNLLGRLKYNFNETYYLEGSLTQGLTSKFAKDVRDGMFYSVGASWILSNENFLSNVDAIDFLKMKFSYGETGNDRGIGSFPYVTLFNTGWNQLGTTGVLAGGLVDSGLSWETTAQTNAGIEFGLFGGKLDGSVEYYERKSIDLIYDKPVPISTGNSSVRTNVGSLKNYGIEVTLSSKIIDKNDLKLNAALNFSTENNEITELTQEEFINGTKKWMVGRSLYDFFIREFAGVDPEDGYAMWYMDVLDADGNPTGERETTKEYGEATRYYIDDKTSLPKYTGGFNASLSYKNFDFSTLIYFSLGSYQYDSEYAGLMNGFERNEQGHPDLFRRWQQPGDITDVPLLLNASNDFNSTSTRFLYKNDWARVKALTIGYNFSDAVNSKLKTESIRLFLQGDNLFTFTGHDGIDPEQTLSGLTNARSSLMKTVSLGLNIKL